MKFAYKILLVVIILVALFLGFYDKGLEPQEEPIQDASRVQDEFASYKIQTVLIKGEAYRMYLADTDELRQAGLSGKSGLSQGCGMMFTFPQAGIYPFWMPDMKFPLDIFWVREGRVVEAWENAPIPTGGTVPSHTPIETADLVLEFRAGFAKEKGIVVGDAVGR